MDRPVLVDAEYNALDSQGDLWGFIRLGLSAQCVEIATVHLIPLAKSDGSIGFLLSLRYLCAQFAAQKTALQALTHFRQYASDLFEGYALQ